MDTLYKIIFLEFDIVYLRYFLDLIYFYENIHPNQVIIAINNINQSLYSFYNITRLKKILELDRFYNYRNNTIVCPFPTNKIHQYIIKYNYNNNSCNNFFECSICYEFITNNRNQVLFDCYHKICAMCAIQYLMNKNICHMCRIKIKEIIIYNEKIHQILA